MAVSPNDAGFRLGAPLGMVQGQDVLRMMRLPVFGWPAPSGLASLADEARSTFLRTESRHSLDIDLAPDLCP